MHYSNFISREVICFLTCLGSHRLRWKGTMYLPVVMMYCQMTQLVRNAVFISPPVNYLSVAENKQQLSSSPTQFVSDHLATQRSRRV